MEKTDITRGATEYIRREQDPRFKAEVERLLADEDWKELEDRFYRDMEFGTGGLRGIIGGGFNRMNTFVVKRATQGLATYLKNAFPEKDRLGQLKAVIAFDSRRYSIEFAEAAALVLGANGIKTYLFSALRPTPELSFAIRTLGCDTGIVVTASHNPPAYNGYKAYWNRGAQVIPPHDQGIIREVNQVKDIQEISRESALANGLLEIIDARIDDSYQAMVKSRLFRPELIQAMGKDVKIVYSPLHGTGAMHVEKILGDCGLQVITVPEQREPDGEFPTVSYPNPEEAAALDLAITLGKKVGADVVMATDPDADRLGIAIPAKNSGAEREFILVTGNQLGALLADYIFLSLKETGKLPAKPAMVNSIVTTGMQRKVAALYGAECFECLTGFKWIADVWDKTEADGRGYQVVYGTEESYGYLVEPDIRDKDGVSAAAMTAEMTLYWRSKGKSLLDRLEELYHATGYWEELGVSKTFQGPEGPGIMKGIMAEFRRNPPKSFGGIAVTKIRDVLESRWVYPQEPGRTEGVDLPKEDVLQFYLEDGTIVSARPSGTEPKIKFYASACTELTGDLPSAVSATKVKLAAIEQDIRKAIGD